MTVKAIKGLGKAYEKFISRGKDLPYDSKKIGKMLDEVSGKFKKAGVTGDKSKTKDFDKIINQKAPTPSKAGSAPTKKSMDFEKDSSGVVTPKPSGKKTETEAYLKNRKKPTTYKGTKFENKMRDNFNEARSKNQGTLVTPEVERYRKGEKFLNKKNRE
jgi:hypothetical protein